MKLRTTTLLGALLTASTAAAERPNVVLIYADDLGKGMLSHYGQQQFATPHIDRLFDQGIVMNNAYGCMLSAPARASLLTGYHDCHADKWNTSRGGQFVTTDTTIIAAREQAIDASCVRLPPGDPYLAQVFQQAGYATTAIGKLEWGFTATRRQMTERGWTDYYGYLDHVRCHGFFPPFLFSNGTIELLPANTHANCAKSAEPESEQAYADRWDMQGKAIYAPDKMIERAERFIEQYRHTPFFLFYPTTLPHGPVQVQQVDARVEHNDKLTPIEKEYASMVLMLDDQVGRIVAALARNGLSECTLILFTSDNGHEIYYAQPGRVSKPYRNTQTGSLFDDYTQKYYSNTGGDVFDGNAGLAGLKRSNLEGAVRVPLTFYWPSKWKNPKQYNDLVALYDLLPTFAEWVGTPIGKKDGLSLAAILDGTQSVALERTVCYSSFLGPAIVRADGWKLRYYAPKGIYELYHLPSDPRETTDVAPAHEAIVSVLKKELLIACGGQIEQGLCRN